MKHNNFMKFLVLIIGFTTASIASASCSDVTRSDLKTAVHAAVTDTSSFGFGLPMWVTMVDETGKVCHVISSDGTNINKGKFAGNTAWLGSRVISAQKANTANAFSLDGLAISSGAISVTVYPEGSLYGLQFSNPVHPGKAYAGNPNDWGTASDPMTGKRLGGVNVFGGGVALYSDGVKIGAIGASGDTSCRDHTVAYRVRVELGLYASKPNDDGLTMVDPPAGLFQIPSCGVDDPTTNADDGSASDFGIRAP